jgi:RNA recognition motif-containing protein
LKANIITHGTRSRGYGFVTYDTLAQAEQAALTYNKAELGGREINVEVAKPKVERAPAAPKVKTPKQPKAETKEATETGEAADVKPRTGRNPRSRASRKTNRNKVFFFCTRHTTMAHFRFVCLFTFIYVDVYAPFFMIFHD